MSVEIEHQIRQRAHSIWEQEGRPSGRADAHWAMASAELTAKTAARKRASRPAAAKAAVASVSKAAPTRRSPAKPA
jgi:hypothetical protein